MNDEMAPAVHRRKGSHRSSCGPRMDRNCVFLRAGPYLRHRAAAGFGARTWRVRTVFL